MYLTVLILPLLSSILCGFFGRFIGIRGSQILSTCLISISAILSFIIFYEVVLLTNIVSFHLFPWLLNSHWGFLFDSLTAIMLIVVTFISALVHLYSIGYMSLDPHVPRFMSYLSIFTFFMLVLVTSDNFLQLFVGWEGVGVASYLLINFWFTRLQANKSAMKAMIVNRIGDFGYVIALFAIYSTFKSLDFEVVFSLAPYVVNDTFILMNIEINKLAFICLFLFIGSMGKSAQLGLHTWLPDAMEGPTPVSALIHAATMVTAGVFLIIRCSTLFELAPNILIIVTIIGALTAFFAATVGLVQNDLKRVIAYSTCSQLGYMVFACGLSHYSVSLFHLMNHAFFKALLFLSAGSIIHALNDEQDMRKMGGLVKLIPFTYSMIVIGSLSLMGFPFLTGYYSKDVILEIAYSSYSISGSFAHWLGVTSAFFTAFYSFRLIALTFLNKTNISKELVNIKHEGSLSMNIPLFILALGSIFIGYLTKDLIIGLGTTILGNAIYQKVENLSIIDAEFLDSTIKMLPVIFSIIGGISALIIYRYYNISIANLKLNKKGVYKFLTKKWYFDKIYNELIVQTLLNLGYNITFKLIDRGILEIVGPYGLVTNINKISKEVSKVQSGLVYHYALLMIIGLTFYITILIIGIEIEIKYIIMGIMTYLIMRKV